MSKPVTSLAVLHGNTYIALSPQFDPRSLGQVIADNTGNKGLSPQDLDRIKIPSGGGLSWEVPTMEVPKPEAAIEGVIIHWRDARAYWQEKFDGANNPPDCVSADGEHGVGNPGGACDDCPLSEFGSAVDARGNPTSGQACKQMRQLFIMLPDATLPTVISLPPTSIQPIGKYFLGLISKNHSYWKVVTRLTLEKAKNSTGIEYSRVKAMPVEVISEEALPGLMNYINAIKPHLGTLDVTTYVQQDTVAYETA